METWPRNSREGAVEPARTQRFEQTVELGRRVPVSDAIHAIAAFHGTADEEVRAAFLNLRDVHEGETAAFDDSVSNGGHCLKIEIFDAAGQPTAFSLIDSETGQPIAHIS